MGLAIECALSRAERQNMLINDLHLTPMQSTALHFFWTEKYKNNSERPVDALAVENIYHSLTDNLKSRDASASKNLGFPYDLTCQVYLEDPIGQVHSHAYGRSDLNFLRL